jgi:hypothetical protein
LEPPKISYYVDEEKKEEMRTRRKKKGGIVISFQIVDPPLSVRTYAMQVAAFVLCKCLYPDVHGSPNGEEARW